MLKIDHSRKRHGSRAQNLYGGLYNFRGIVDQGTSSFNVHPVTRLNGKRAGTRVGAFWTLDSHPRGVDKDTGGRVLDEKELGFAIAIGHYPAEVHQVTLTCLVRAELPGL